jgi:hypothetical protein
VNNGRVCNRTHFCWNCRDFYTCTRKHLWRQAAQHGEVGTRGCEDCEVWTRKVLTRLNEQRRKRLYAQ